MILLSIILMLCACQCSSKFGLNRNDFQMDSFNKGARITVQDSMAQRDNELRANNYARGALSQTSSHETDLSRDVAAGQSAAFQAAQYDQGIFNSSMDRVVGQNALSRHVGDDSGQAIHAQVDRSQVGEGVRREHAFQTTSDRSQSWDDFDLAGQSSFGHNTSQTVIDRGVANVENKHKVGLSPSEMDGSFSVNYAKTQDYSSILDTDITSVAERNALTKQTTRNFQQHFKAGERNSGIDCDGAQAQDLFRADEQSFQHSKLQNVIQERNNLIDESGTKDLRSHLEKSQRSGDISLRSDGSNSGRFAIADFRSFDEATADGGARHLSSKLASTDQEMIDSRHSSSSTTSETDID